MRLKHLSCRITRILTQIFAPGRGATESLLFGSLPFHSPFCVGAARDSEAIVRWLISEVVVGNCMHDVQYVPFRMLRKLGLSASLGNRKDQRHNVRRRHAPRTMVPGARVELALPRGNWILPATTTFAAACAFVVWTVPSPWRSSTAVGGCLPVSTPSSRARLGSGLPSANAGRLPRL